MKRKISPDRIKDFIREAQKAKVRFYKQLKPEDPDPGFFTTLDVVDHTGLHLRRVQRAINDLMRKGSVIVKEFRIQASPINVRVIWHYRVKDQKAKRVLEEMLHFNLDEMLRKKRKK